MEEAMGKNVTLIIRGAPLSSYESWEGLRTALGLTLREHRVRVVFVEDGVYTLLPLEPSRLNQPGFDQFLESLKDLEVPLIAERESVERRGLKELAFQPELMDREAIQELLVEDFAVMTFS